MKVKFKLNQVPSKKGFAVVMVITHKRVRKHFTLAHAQKNEFSSKDENVKPNHPDYEILAPKILSIKLRARKLAYSNYTSIDSFYNDLFKEDIETILFMEAANGIIADMAKMILAIENSGNAREANRMKGNIKVYKNVLGQFEPFCQNTTLVDFDYNLLLRFKNYQLGIGNAKATVHNYLRTIRAIYKKAALKYKIPAANPFVGVFAGLTIKSYASRKKHLDKQAIVWLENYNPAPHYKKYLDLWLLQFYFGGADLIDLYYLHKKNIRRGRVYFERNKTGSGLPIDLKIHPKAYAILQRYTTNTEWLFPFEKSKERYESFRSAYGKALRQIQKELQIEVLPNGGFIGIKVARHTFATIGKNLLIHEDILRELMGHERNEVDNFYKDKFPEAMRDEALFRIID